MSRFINCAIVLLSLYACSVNNTKEDDSIARYFRENNVEGTFGLYDNGNGRFTIYNIPRFRDSAYLPASTFKIVNSLIGIEIGRIKDSATVIPWDSITRSIPEWNHNLTMQEAFTLSCVPWYQQLARRIGKDTMQHWIDTLGYGSLHKKPLITNNLDTFWLDNSVKVTADEQMGLVKKLYFLQLPFQPRSQRMVKNLMKREDSTLYKLSYKTGWGTSEKKHAIGWLTGWIEENNHPYFFVLQVESADPAFPMNKVREKMLKDILRKYGFMEGKR